MRERDSILRQSGLEFREPLWRNLRRFGQELRLFELQAARRMDRPGPREMIGVGEPDVATLVIGEIEVVVAEPAFDPVGHADRGRALNVRADAGMQVGRDDRPVDQSLHAQGWFSLFFSGG